MALEQCAPHATARQCVAASFCTMRGCVATVCLPSPPVPSWPCELEPQARTSPASVTTRACSVPRATALIRWGHSRTAIGTDEAPSTARPHIHSVQRVVGSAPCLGLGPRANTTSSPRTSAARTSNSASAGPRDVTRWQDQPSRPRFAAMKAWRRPTVESHQADGSLIARSWDPSRRWKLNPMRSAPSSGGPKETCRNSLAECPSAQAQLTPRFRACSRRALAPNALLLGPAAAITCRSGVERQAPLPPHAGSEVGSEAGRASTTGTGVALWAAAAAPGGCEGAATG